MLAIGTSGFGDGLDWRMLAWTVPVCAALAYVFLPYLIRFRRAAFRLGEGTRGAKGDGDER
jgi:hypothetical protein